MGKIKDIWDGWQRIRAILVDLEGQVAIERYISLGRLRRAAADGRYRGYQIATDLIVWEEVGARQTGWLLGMPAHGSIIITGTRDRDGHIGDPWHLPKGFKLLDAMTMLYPVQVEELPDDLPKGFKLLDARTTLYPVQVEEVPDDLD